MDSRGRVSGAVELAACSPHSENQKLELTSRGYLQFAAVLDQKLVCVRVNLVSQVPCGQAGAWDLTEKGELRSAERPGMCLDRGLGGEEVDLRACSGAAGQRWAHRKVDAGGGGTLSGPSLDACLDNMQRSSGPPGLYGCHGGGTQQWVLPPGGGKLRSSFHQGGDGVCLGFGTLLGLAECLVEDPGSVWTHRGAAGHRSLRPAAAPDLCLAQAGGGSALALQPCDDEAEGQRWKHAGMAA